MEPGAPTLLIPFKGDSRKLLGADHQHVVVAERDIARVFDVSVRYFLPLFDLYCILWRIITGVFDRRISDLFYLMRLKSGKAIAELRGHKNAITCIELTLLHGEPILITGSKDKTVVIWTLTVRTHSLTS